MPHAKTRHARRTGEGDAVSLRDYVARKDKFKLHRSRTGGFVPYFPCCCCVNRWRPIKDEPCATCGHNPAAAKPKTTVTP